MVMLVLEEAVDARKLLLLTTHLLLCGLVPVLDDKNPSKNKNIMGIVAFSILEIRLNFYLSVLFTGLEIDFEQ